MRDLKRPAFMREAAEKSRGYNAMAEILIALLVFLVASIGMSVAQMPFFAGYLLQSGVYQKMILTGDLDAGRIMELIMDLPEWMLIATLCTEIILIVVVLLYCRFFEKRGLRTAGFCKKRWFVNYLKGAVLGMLFFAAAYLVCLVTGSIRCEGISDQMVPGYLVGYLFGYLIQGMAEEVLCRGYLFVSLSRRYSVSYSAVLSASFFALLHGMNSGLSFLAMFNIFLFGIFAALMLVRYENIWIVGAFHSLWNFAQGNLFGVQVSGMEVQNSVLATTSKENFSVINGGNFGMEGGLGVTLVLGIGIFWMLRSLERQNKIIKKDIAPQEEMVQPKESGLQAETILSKESMPQGEVIPEEKTVSQENDTPQRENMGLNPDETPWHPESSGPEEKAEENRQTEYDENYFKD